MKKGGKGGGKRERRKKRRKMERRKNPYFIREGWERRCGGQGRKT